MEKAWIIKVSYGFNCVNYYGAYSHDDPFDKIMDDDDLVMQIEEDLWTDYGWTVTGWANENMENPDDEEELEQIYEDFKSNIDWECEEDEFGDVENYDIIYDEREN